MAIFIALKCVYEKPSKSDGYRILVDRLWPRGIKKEEALINCWLRDIAPSHGLRKWFQHGSEKWLEFKERYFLELKESPELLNQLVAKVQEQPATLVFGARDKKHNNAVALKEYLEKEFFF